MSCTSAATEASVGGGVDDDDEHADTARPESKHNADEKRRMMGSSLRRDARAVSTSDVPLPEDFDR
jgi:hypothetical protein